MSVSVDKDPTDEGEDARRVLASWLDDYIGGRCERADMQESFLSVCRSNPDAPWDALALLDQYQRRGRIDPALARTLKSDIAQLVFGNANQTGAPRDQTQATLDTTGSRWRKLLAESEPQTADVEPAFVDPTLFRRDFDPATRPPAKVRDEPPAARPSVQKDVLRDRYELLSVLGRGSSGTVYKALDRHREHLSPAARQVAVKVLKLDYRNRPDALAELEREFHQAQSLSHPNIVSVFDLDRDGDTYFVVMELLEGELLADVMQRLHAPLEQEHALAIVSSVGAALAHAHRRDIVHADLKPRNIMITSSGEVRVLDFGFARHRSLDLHSASIFGTAPASAPAYASIERVTGSEPHPSDDVYSLACIAYELLSGEHPFGGRSAVLARAHGRPPRSIPGVSRKQMQVLNRALLWGRGERKIDIVDLLSGLGCAEASTKLVPPELLVARDQGSLWRRRLLGAAAFAALVGAGVAGFLYLERQPLPERSAAAATPAVEPAGSAAADANGNAGNVEGPPALAVEKPETQAEAVVQPSRTTVPGPFVAAPRAAAAAASPGPIAIEFDKDTYVATESDGAVRVIVQRSEAQRATGGRAPFRWSLSGNSAEPGSDFAGIGPGTEEIAPGATSVAITIPLVSDAVVENTEVFLVEIEPMQAGVTVGERAHAAVIVVDDD